MEKDYSPQLPINDNDGKAMADFVEYIENFCELHKGEIPPKEHVDEIIRLMTETKHADVRLCLWAACQRDLNLLLKIFPFVGDLMVETALKGSMAKLLEHATRHPEIVKRNPKAFPLLCECRKRREEKKVQG